MAKIYKIFTREILFEDNSLSFKKLVEKHKRKLKGADLSDANLDDADLRGANLWGANLRGAGLSGANLEGAKILNYKEIGGIGNNRRLLRCFRLDNNSFYFMAGCFSGTEQELKEKVIKKYGSDCEYIEAIEFLKNLCIKYRGE